ncbi:hypothetical protein AKJ09_07066 [Labilithrix luteola]|uniref:Uncharacterized protein n=1 Tax=Labilithrix luteola TaxID=1391654 RepID=A0A0K1Q3S6_9BACT|nr:hypothetical protein AKJ09_07066 [Labilithrix luteola]
MSFASLAEDHESSAAVSGATNMTNLTSQPANLATPPRP